MSESSPATTDRVRTRGGERPSGAVFALADGLALLAFVAVGLRSHRLGALAEIAARNAIPLAVPGA